MMLMFLDSIVHYFLSLVNSRGKSHVHRDEGFLVPPPAVAEPESQQDHLIPLTPPVVMGSTVGYREDKPDNEHDNPC